MFSLAVTFAPAIGPTIGGYLSENYGWQTIFFVNVIPTAVMVTTLYLTLERQPTQLGLLKEGDWFGIATMAIGLSALQTVLEEGNKDDWFGSPFIVRLAVISAVSLSLFIANELIVEKPLLRLRLLTSRNFGLGTIAAVFLGFGLFGSIYLLPAYLGQVQRYNAEQIGNVLAWTGLPQLLLIPLVPLLCPFPIDGAASIRLPRHSRAMRIPTPNSNGRPCCGARSRGARIVRCCWCIIRERAPPILVAWNRRAAGRRC